MQQKKMWKDYRFILWPNLKTELLAKLKNLNFDNTKNMAQSKGWDTDKTQKVILKLKIQTWVKPKELSQEKNYFWQKVFELEQQMMQYNWAAFCSSVMFPNGC